MSSDPGGQRVTRLSPATRCPAAKCQDLVAPDQVACKRHWFKIPKPLRDRIWRLFQAERGSDAHRAAVFEAIEFLQFTPKP